MGRAVRVTWAVGVIGVVRVGGQGGQGGEWLRIKANQRRGKWRRGGCEEHVVYSEWWWWVVPASECFWELGKLETRNLCMYIYMYNTTYEHHI